jgi:phosphoglycolate phosphatase-like HAD superfamily hydrolase
MSKTWELEYVGAGSCSGSYLRAEYVHAPSGWLVRYLAGDRVIAASTAPRHPSLRMLGADAAGEKRVIKTALAVIDSIEDAMYAQAAREVRPARVARPARRKASAPRRALA